MSTNRTSEAAARILYFIEDNDVVTWHAKADRHLREVLQKYNRMEEALRYIHDGYKTEWLPEWVVKQSEQALAFDPLSDDEAPSMIDDSITT